MNPTLTASLYAVVEVRGQATTAEQAPGGREHPPARRGDEGGRREILTTTQEVKDTTQETGERTTRKAGGATQETSAATQEIGHATQDRRTTQERIPALLEADPRLTRRLLAERLGVTAGGVEYHPGRLRAAGTIRHVGATKAGRGEVLK